jgi:hypothetical protein
MKKFTNKRSWAVVLAVVLILSLAVTALAVWPSFQNDNTNNGVIPAAPTPPTAPIPPTTVTPVKLQYGPGAFDCVDTTQLMETVGYETYTYVFYDGGSANGARLAKYNCASLPTPVAPEWDIQVDPSSGFQLSTPYLDASGRCIYVATNNGNLYRVAGIDSSAPTAKSLLTTPVAGQPNTPITPDTDKDPQYLYFGTFTGGKSGLYYQYAISSGNLVIFKPPSGDDFYWAGAAIVPINNADYVVFGGDSGLIYVVPETSFTSPANVITLDTVDGTAPGQVRSSVMYKGEYVLFTSQGGSSTTGILWQLEVASLLKITTTSNGTPLDGRGSSTSTPVWSANGIIYVGTYNGFSSGTVDAYKPGSAGAAPAYIATIYTVDPVQSSVIVWSDTDKEIDYVYFTTNIGSGAGYCYSVNTGSTPVSSQQMWTYANNPSNPYSLQGMASQGGYNVWGDDGGFIYIAH